VADLIKKTHFGAEFCRATSKKDNNKKEIKSMKSTGVVRKVDELGRIVLPISIRQIMDINEKDSLEIFTDDNKIILQKYQPSCIFCNNADDIVFFNGKRVCENCLKKIKETF
jgi:transcriptional pleiotropic regulator of transition state genes